MRISNCQLSANLFYVWDASFNPRVILDRHLRTLWWSGVAVTRRSPSSKLTYVGPGSVPGAGHLFSCVTSHPGQLSLPSLRVGIRGSASAGKAKAGMVHSVSGWTQGVQVKLWDPLRTRAIPERLRGVFTTRRYTNSRLPLRLPFATKNL